MGKSEKMRFILKLEGEGKALVLISNLRKDRKKSGAKVHSLLPISAEQAVITLNDELGKDKIWKPPKMRGHEARGMVQLNRIGERWELDEQMKNFLLPACSCQSHFSHKFYEQQSEWRALLL